MYVQYVVHNGQTRPAISFYHLYDTNIHRGLNTTLSYSIELT